MKKTRKEGKTYTNNDDDSQRKRNCQSKKHNEMGQARRHRNARVIQSLSGDGETTDKEATVIKTTLCVNNLLHIKIWKTKHMGDINNKESNTF